MASQFYTILFIVAPSPRPPTRAEKSFRRIKSDGTISVAQELPCWQDVYKAQKEAAQKKGDFSRTRFDVEEPEVYISVVVPAYNEEDRLGRMLAEAVEYLEQEYKPLKTKEMANGHAKSRMNGKGVNANGSTQRSSPEPKGWEIIIVSDGSTDKTVDTALKFALSKGGNTASSIRVVSLHENRGKGGAVTHGMRHVRGKYAIFADADGASRFKDLGKLIQACQQIEDGEGRGVAVGSRAHLVGSDSVVTVSFRTSQYSQFIFLTDLAFFPAKLPDAFFSSHPPYHDTTCHRFNLRYSMRLQTVLPTFTAIYNTLHAL
jgi:dolichyl-phosphate beta-glucosyltransferase